MSQSLTNRPPSERLTLVALRPEHAREAARLHILGQPGTFLTSLGLETLTVLYRTLPLSRVGFGFAAVSPERSDRLLGFVSATTSVGLLFLELGVRHLPAFLPPLLRRFVQEPSLAVRAAQTLLYPFLHGASEGGAPSAELLSIMVTPDARRFGVGGLLVTALMASCQRREIEGLDVTVDAANDGARRFYARHGFRHDHDFVLYGRTMCLYRAKVRASSR